MHLPFSEIIGFPHEMQRVAHRPSLAVFSNAASQAAQSGHEAVAGTPASQSTQRNGKTRDSAALNNPETDTNILMLPARFCEHGCPQKISALTRLF
jgi:hypothetical protein